MGLLCVMYYVADVTMPKIFGLPESITIRGLVLLHFCTMYGLFRLKLGEQVPILYLLLIPVIAAIFPVIRNLPQITLFLQYFAKFFLMFSWLMYHCNVPVVIIESKSHFWLEMLPIAGFLSYLTAAQIELTRATSRSMWHFAKRDRLMLLSLASTDSLLW
jgi:hypothetical protein